MVLKERNKNLPPAVWAHGPMKSSKNP